LSNYTKATNFATKDTLPTGDSNKIVKGTEIDNEFNAISGAISSKADIASPTFTGTPSAPTATSGSNTTQVATTAFVFAERANTATLTNKTVDLASNTVTGTLAQFNTACSNADFVSVAGTETLTNKTLTNPTVTTGSFSSPALTGTPTAPTASAGTNTTQVATTEFVTAATVAERTATSTYTNKTLTSPTINTPTITGGLISGITDLAVADGGTGSSTAAGALTNLGAYPATNPNGYTNNTGTVTSVATGNGLSGGTITTTGTLSVACPASNTVGSYAFVQLRPSSSGGYNSNYAIGSGANQLMLGMLTADSTSENQGNDQTVGWNLTTSGISGTWKWMGNTNGGNHFAIACRVS
jgi:hypothetical protein